MSCRASGVLLHITSLPSNFGIGDLGPAGYCFVDLLYEAKQRFWSILPVTATSIGGGNSPYNPTSAFATNNLLISPELLVKDRLLLEEDINGFRLPFGRIDFKAVITTKDSMLKKAYKNFCEKQRTGNDLKGDFEKFNSENASWIEPFAEYMAIKRRVRKPWYEWPPLLRDRDPDALRQKRTLLKDLIEEEKFGQFIFTRQWILLRQYCKDKNVSLIGDISFYVSYDSADLWLHPELFKLDKQKNLKYVSGVPPDYFSKDGQRWGNPVYDWHKMKETGFRWWIERIQRNLSLCDFLRIDHFRAFTAYWQIPASSKTAKTGKWIRVPTKTLFKNLKTNFPNLPFIAEDLGHITDAVRKSLKKLEIPGMRVLIFGFDGSEDNPNLPENFPKNSIAYTGTHDTNTVKGWFNKESNPQTIEFVNKYLGKVVSKNNVCQEFIKMVMQSKSKLSLIPLQDILCLGSDSRINNPSRESNNWDWRVQPELLSSKNFEKLAELTKETRRI